MSMINVQKILPTGTCQATDDRFTTMWSYIFATKRTYKEKYGVVDFNDGRSHSAHGVLQTRYYMKYGTQKSSHEARPRALRDMTKLNHIL